MPVSENTKSPEEYVPPTPEERRKMHLKALRERWKRLGDVLKNAHTIDIKVRKDGREFWYEGDFIKYLDEAFPELMEDE